MKTFTATPATDEAYLLAEGPVWDAPRERLLWVDIDAGRVLTGRLDGNRIHAATELLSRPETIGAVVCSAAGDLLVAAATTLITVATDGSVSTGDPLVPAGRASRFNDGKCDPAGRFLIGTMALDDRTGDDRLLSVDGGRVTVVDDDLTLSNGLAWSPDGTTMYSIDTVPGIVWQRGYDVAGGTWGERQRFLHLADGNPDGMCVDAKGNLWIAVWGAGQVRCFTPGGEHLATVEVPAPHTSSVAFAGPDLDRLMITTAQGGDGEHPDAGRLFVAQVEVTGHPVAPWHGPAGRQA